jgi:hypothetical protein
MDENGPSVDDLSKIRVVGMIASLFSVMVGIGEPSASFSHFKLVNYYPLVN